MSDWLNRCHFGDVREVLLRMIADGVKVQTIVTSPPYWGLRSYLPAGHPLKAKEIGSEPTLAEFLEVMVYVFDLCRQVLADDGTMWVNMGDSYSRAPGKGGSGPGGKNAAYSDSYTQAQSALVGSSDGAVWRADRPGTRAAVDGLPEKNLMGQPWRLAFALQDAGWYLRQEIIWGKVNPMPESATDRFTKAHEQLFLLSKNPRYYFDQEAVLEPASPGTHARMAQNVAAQRGSTRAYGNTEQHRPMKAVGRRMGPPGNPVDGEGVKNNGSFNAAMAIMPSLRNPRSVWMIASEPYSGAHFATFPTELVRRPILAGCPEGGTVLDIFFGSGTTGQVAKSLGRNWIGIDLDERNGPLQQERLATPIQRLAQRGLDLRSNDDDGQDARIDAVADLLPLQRSLE